MQRNLLDRLSKYIENLDYCTKYGEPGYTDPENGILFANWNNVSKRLQSFLEAKGFELEWSDEWTIDYDNDKAYRTSPDGYDWTPSFVWTEDGEMITADEVEEDATFYIEWLLNSPSRCSTFRTFNPEDHGFVKFNPTSYESGWHPGQTDDPKIVAKEIKKKLPDHDSIFVKDEQSQFYCRWSAWIRTREAQDGDIES